MDKAIEQLFKTFSHLARDIQNYIFSGFIILANIYLIDFFYYSGSVWKHLSGSNLFIPGIIIVAYILGHISLGFYTVLLEWKEVDKKMNGKLFKKRFSEKSVSDTETVTEKIKAFNKSKSVYFHFIEREYILSNIRWNYSASFLLVSICDFIFVFFKGHQWQVLLTAILALVAAFFLLLLSVFTQKENGSQIAALLAIPNTEKVKAGGTNVEDDYELGVTIKAKGKQD